MQCYSVVILLLTWTAVGGETSANVEIVSSGNCGAEILRQKGLVDPKAFRPKIVFDPKNLRLSPAKPTVPGCFRLIANNVTIANSMSQLTAEFEMRISGTADPSKPALQCKRRTSNCGCGDHRSCMYCDFCKNLHRLVNGAVVNNKKVNVPILEQCDCDIPADTYRVDAEVCTPDANELGDNLPGEVLSYVSEGSSFSLFTTLYLYDFRFNALADIGAAGEAALRARKAKGLVGCYVVVSNVRVNLD